MDVVRTHVEAAGGQVRIESAVGRGTTIRLEVPLSLAIIPVLLVSARGQRFAVPQADLLELALLEDERTRGAIEHVRGAPVLRLRDELLPLVPLGGVLQLGAAPLTDAPEGAHVVVVAAGDRRFGLVVDAVHDTEEIVVKPLHAALRRLGCYAGAAALGDGGVALILDARGLAARAGVDVAASRALEAPALEPAASDRQPSLVFRAGAGVQCTVPLSMVARLERVARSSIERVGASEVVQYRDTIMPIVRPEAVVPLGAAPAGPDDGEQALVVFEFGQPVALAVTEIVDVVELPLGARSPAQDTLFTLGKTVAFDKTTLVLDVYRIVRELAPAFIGDRRRAARALRVVVADASPAMRGALGAYLRSMGVEVVEADGPAAALRELGSARAGRVDAVVAEVSADEADGFDLLAALRRDRPALPVFGWIADGDASAAERALSLGARACVSRLRREELVAAFEKHGLGFRRSEDRRSA
jgi:two-component system chemotaxis sensor kinase CheA